MREQKTFQNMKRYLVCPSTKITEWGILIFLSWWGSARAAVRVESLGKYFALS
jgi:hypothetical protein